MAHWWYLITMILWILENFHRDSQDLEIHTVETRASIYSGRRVFDLPFQITIHGLFWIPTLPQGSANRHRKKKSALKGLESQKICWSNPCGVFDGERSCWSPCFPLVKSAIFGLNAWNPCSCSDPLASQHASCAWVRELPHSQGLRSALVMGLASAENEKIFCATKSASSSSRSLINIHEWW